MRLQHVRQEALKYKEFDDFSSEVTAELNRFLRSQFLACLNEK
jgi:hypothetical protein